MSLDQTTSFSAFTSEMCLSWEKSYVCGTDNHIYNQYWVKHCMSDGFTDVHWKSGITQVFVFIFRLVGSPCTGRFCFSAQQGETSRASSLFSLSQPCWKSEPLIWSVFNAYCTCVCVLLCPIVLPLYSTWLRHVLWCIGSSNFSFLAATWS